MRIVVYGRPETQGSAQAFVRKDGRAQIVQGGSGERRRRLEDWRQAIRTEAQAVMGPEGTLLDGPVALVLSFGLPKPQSAPKKRRTWPIGARSGDIDKLERAVLDALTGVVWHDDSQVVAVLKVKDFAGRPGIVVETFGESPGWATPGRGELDSALVPWALTARGSPPGRGMSTTQEAICPS